MTENQSGNFYYEIIGEGFPIFDIHGWTMSHQISKTTFEPVYMDRLGWKRIYFDLPGHGRTPGFDWVQNSEDMLQAVMNFIDEIIPGQPFALNSYSYGGYLARGLIYHWPERVAGISLQVPMIKADDRDRITPAPKVLYRAEGLADLITPEQQEEFDQIVVVQTKEIIGEFLKKAEVPADEDFLLQIRTDPEKYGFSFDVDDLPAPFENPALFIMGKYDSVVGYQQALDLAERYPRATTAVLDRAGHILILEQPDLVRALFGEWLDRVKEYNIEDFVFTTQ